MIRRLKRATKKRKTWSTQRADRYMRRMLREWVASPGLAKKLAEQVLADLSRPMWRFDDPITPDVWAP